MSPADLPSRIEAVWRIESPRLIAGLTRVVRDVGLAEEFAQDALVAALEQWPGSGVPENPGAWLMSTARRRAIDSLRRGRREEPLQEGLAAGLAERLQDDRDAELDGAVEDDLLRLMFLACHPLLPKEARVALTLRLVGGLSTAEIARGYLVPEATIAQRIVRAKRALTEQRARFELPRGPELERRLTSVLEVIYLVFNEGYSATSGDEWLRPALCDEALRLARILASLAPAEPEAHGLAALLEIQASRAQARVGSSGEPVLLLDQDRGRWDRVLIERGLAALARAEALGGEDGFYVLQAAIVACHARARTAQETDWRRIVGLYDRLLDVAPSPVIALNRAVAVGMADGPAAALALVDRLAGDPALASYPWLPSVRGDLLAKLGRSSEARSELERAAELTQNARERELLLRRAAACVRQ